MASQPIPACAPVDAVSLEPEMLIPLAAGVAYAAPGAFLAWLQRAKPGQACIYARASMLSHREPIGATVRLVSDAGQVTTYQSRPAALFPYLYFARRTVKPLTMTPSPARLRVALSDTQRQLLDHLAELAEAGQPHGSNSGLAMRLGLGSRETVANALGALERLGFIRRAQDEVFSRVIEIVETGRKTRGCR
jgi:DNA-binding MarR family transcriptional regulator